MATTVLVAAGGGGDALAANVIQQATAGAGQRAVFVSWSWERLIVDPVPGPRDPTGFRGLQRCGRWNYRVRPQTVTRPPNASLLPRLAAALGTELYLLDPREGATGLHRQLAELIELVGADIVQVVDVGGDILAVGQEPGLRSPLADSLVLAASADLGLPTDVLVAGAGLDAELPESVVLQRCEALGGQPWYRLGPEDVAPFLPLLRWHPSEVTGLLLRAAQGYRGVAELRDGGHHVRLSDGSPDVYRVPHAAALGVNELAQPLRSTRSLADAEGVLGARGRPSEIGYERRKATRLTETATPVDVDVILRWLAEQQDELLAEGVDFLALRRIADAVGLSAAQLSDLGRALDVRHHPQYLPPVWVVRPG